MKRRYAITVDVDSENPSKEIQSLCGCIDEVFFEDGVTLRDCQLVGQLRSTDEIEPINPPHIETKGP